MIQKKAILWFTGLSGSGKTSIAKEILEQLKKNNVKSVLIDADNIKYVVKNKGHFTEHDRVKNRDLIINKIKKFYKKDYIVIASFISPFKKDREYVKTFFNENFYEIYVNTPIEVCKKRDPKGLYKKAENGELKNFIGVHTNYEVPESPDLVINSADASIEDCTAKIMKFIVEKILTGEK